MDESGIFVKVKYNNDIRKMFTRNMEMSYDDFVLMIVRLFKGEIEPSCDIVIRYLDDDNDWILLTDEEDLALALKTTSMKLSIKIEKADEKNELNVDKIRETISQLNHQLRVLSEDLSHLKIIPSAEKESVDDNLDKIDHVSKNEKDEQPNKFGKTTVIKDTDILHQPTKSLVSESKTSPRNSAQQNQPHQPDDETAQNQANPSQTFHQGVIQRDQVQNQMMTSNRIQSQDQRSENEYKNINQMIPPQNSPNYQVNERQIQQQSGKMIEDREMANNRGDMTPSRPPIRNQMQHIQTHPQQPVQNQMGPSQTPPNLMQNQTPPNLMQSQMRPGQSLPPSSMQNQMRQNQIPTLQVQSQGRQVQVPPSSVQNQMQQNQALPMPQKGQTIQDPRSSQIQHQSQQIPQQHIPPQQIPQQHIPPQQIPQQHIPPQQIPPQQRMNPNQQPPLYSQAISNSPQQQYAHQSQPTSPPQMYPGQVNQAYRPQNDPMQPPLGMPTDGRMQGQRMPVGGYPSGSHPSVQRFPPPPSQPQQ